VLFWQTRPPVHALPHCPQLAASLARLAQLAPQGVVPLGQDVPHWLWEHSCPPEQAVAQSPQWLPSFVRSKHALVIPGQLVRPAMHTHAPALHV
jgi:hypothetical protein